MTESIVEFHVEMQQLLGDRGWLAEPADLSAYGSDWLKRYGETPIGVARPSTTEEVAAVVKSCVTHGISISPQGGNTGLVGGGVLSCGAKGIILSLARMNRIVTIDPIDFTATVEAGVVLEMLHGALAGQKLMFPLHLGSQGSAQIGGLIATNAGGSHAMRYGMMQDLVLGLEVVLADGSVWNGLRRLIKDNGGYQLRRLFCGSEGTLGIVTRAVLRLHPEPVSRATALLAVASLDAAVQAGAFLRARTGEFLTAIEFFNELGLGLLRKHVAGIVAPIETPGPVYLLVELATSIPGVELSEILENALGESFEAGIVTDGAIAANEAQRQEFWRIREEMPEGQRLEGAQIKHDVAAPVGRLPAFVAAATAATETVLSGVRINPFGHLGDGNVHLNLTLPEGAAGFSGLDADLSEAVYAAAVAHDGTFAAEHGVGQSKVGLADRYRSDVERDLMRSIKRAIDPRGKLNPGKVVV